MTKEQLLKELERVPDGAEIYFIQDEHDYFNTEIAKQIHQLAECPAKKDHYKLVVMDEMDADDAEQHIWVVC